jgi:hypothetical protein
MPLTDKVRGISCGKVASRQMVRLPRQVGMTLGAVRIIVEPSCDGCATYYD